MKLEKKHWIIIGVILVIIIIWWYSSNKKKEEESDWWIFGSKKAPLKSISPNQSGCVNCWVSSTEDGIEYCRWYDNFGRNSQTYAGRGCNSAQASMGGVSQTYGNGKKKPWWAALFEI